MLSFFHQKIRRIIPQISILLFSVVLSHPLMKTQMTCSDDGAFHIHKALGLELMINSGHWFPRWSAHMAHGFGYPLYNFYAPLSSYFLALIHNLGPIYPLSLHIALSFCIALSGIAIFCLARDLLGTWGAIAAAVLYQTSPYLAYNILFRGALAESLAISLLPLVFWTINRTVQYRSLRWCMFSALSLGALIYTHNTTALLIIPLLAIKLIVLAIQTKSIDHIKLGVFSIFLALLLSAHFWLPALSEKELVKTDQLLVPPVFSYATNFLSTNELFAFPGSSQTNLVNPSPAKAIGAFAAFVAVFGLIVLLIKSRLSKSYSQHTLVFVLFGLGALIYSFLTLPISKPLWDLIPLLKFVQFPWRTLGIATMCFSILGGSTLLLFRKNNYLIGCAVICCLSYFAHLSWWYPRYCTNFEEVYLSSMLDYEYNTSTIGTSAKGEFTPKTTLSYPDDQSLSNKLKTDPSPFRVIGIPKTASIKVLRTDPLDHLFIVDSDQAFKATYQMVYFLGWKTTINNSHQKISINNANGLIGLEVPKGKHVVRIYFGTTPIRMLSSSMSVFSLVLVLAILIISNPNKLSFESTHYSYFYYIALLPMLLLVFKLTFIDNTNNWFRSAYVSPHELGTPLNIDSSQGLKPIAFSTSPKHITSGESVEITLYLQATSAVSSSYKTHFLIKGPDDTIWNLSPYETTPPRWHREPPPTQYWQQNNYGQFARLYQTLPGTPPGEYTLLAKIFEESSLEALRFVSSDLLSQYLPLGTVSIVRPSNPNDVYNSTNPSNNIGAITEHITLLNGTADKSYAVPGEQVTLKLLFRANEDPPPDTRFSLFVNNEPLKKNVFLTPNYNTALWKKNDVWLGQHTIRIPATTLSGKHTWKVVSESHPDLSFGSVVIQEPKRTYVPPNVANISQTSFDDYLFLYGHEASTEVTPLDSMSVVLLWKPTKTPIVSLRSFVHIEDVYGNLVAQNDSVPGGWLRPSQGWVPNEYISDKHNINTKNLTPQSTYNIYIGLYEAPSGVRLKINNANEASTRLYLGSFVVNN